MADNSKKAFSPIDESEFRKTVKTKPARGYLFYGEEDYLKGNAMKTARDAICPDEFLVPFNDVRLEGLSVTPDSLMTAVSTLPMMSERKLIEVTGLDFGSMKSDELDAYLEVLASLEEYDYNTVIISVASGCIDEGYPKKPSAILKKLGEYLVPVRFGQVTLLMLSRWVGRHFAFNELRADAAVCQRVVEYCGTDMLRLAAEIDKISWYVKASGRDAVEPSDVTDAGIADTGYDNFAFVNALGSRDKTKALAVLAEMKRRKIEPTFIMGEISRFVCELSAVKQLFAQGMTQSEISGYTKIHEYKVSVYLKQKADREQIVRMTVLCAEADAAIKLLASGDGYRPIERFICSL